MPIGFEVFLSPEAIQINKARQEHLAALGLDLEGKRVLEVGGGIGLHTYFFEQRGCTVVSTDARLENVLEMRRLYPHRWVEVLDLDVASDLSYLGQFDIVFCYGTLYHLGKPEQAIQTMAQVCKEMLLLETCVTPGEELEIYPELEDPDNPNQAKSGLGCRPTRPWVMAMLQKYFNSVYVTKYQPYAPDFDLDWQNPLIKKLHRAVFVGAQQPILNPKLLETLPAHQDYDPDTKKTWIDVGAHLGQTSFEPAKEDPTLKVYAFEPNLRLAAQLFATLPNYVVLPFAVSQQNGFSAFHINKNDATSSLQAFDPEGVKEWILGEQLELEIVTPVPTIRLDAFLAAFDIQTVDYLKVDAQGSDLEVIQSLGDRVQDVAKIKLEVAITPLQPYINAHSKQQVIDFFQDQNFMILAATKQSFDQEENLIIVHRDKFPKITEIETLVEHLVPEAIVPVTEALGVSRPLQPYSFWRSQIDQDLDSQSGKARRVVWNQLIQHKPDAPVKFRWYQDLQVTLNLDCEIDRQLFVDQCYRPNEFYLLNTLLLPQMIVVDLTADHNLYTLFAAACVGETGLVIACRAGQEDRDRLQQDLAFNQRVCGKVISPATSTESSFPSLDSIQQTFDLSRIDVVKTGLLAGIDFASQATQTVLKQFRPVLLLELDTTASDLEQEITTTTDHLKTLGYEMFTIGAFTGLPIAFQVDNGLYSSLLAIHPDGVRNDLISAYIQNETMELARIQRELNWTRSELTHLQGMVEQNNQQAQLQIDQMQAQNTELHEQLKSAHLEISKRDQDVLTLKADLEQAAAHIERLQNTVQAMETSKFWQMRQKWLQIKQMLGMPKSE